MDQAYEDFKRQVKDSSDIVDVISGYISLQKKGRYFWACCPFHGEKTPSFSVDKERQFFYCYGCHTGGDVFSFVQKIENCTFSEAIKTLAGRANIPVPETHRTDADIRRENKRKDMYMVNDLACRYFSACLNKTRQGLAALDYFHNRGISDEIILRFSLGFSLASSTALQTNLKKKGCTVEQLIAAGLVRNKNGYLSDMFSNRVMIPIKDPRGRVIAFGGRVLDDSLPNQPKYLNTGETDIFLKRETLFGMDVAIKAIREAKEAVVVEGYMDAISLHAAGFNRAVASLGTAFSAQHAKLLHRIADVVVFAYDSDDAGRRNAVRAVGIAKKEGLAVKVLNVPEGKDPDEFVRKAGRDAFEDLIKNAWDGTEFQIRYTISQNNVDDLAGKVKCVSNIIPYLKECRTEIEAAGYIKFLAQQLVIDEGLIMGEYRRTATRLQQRDAEPAPVTHSAARVPNALVQAESKLLLLFFRDPGMIQSYKEVLHEIGFVSPVRQSIYNKICELENISNIQECLFADGDEEIRTETARILSGEEFSPDEQSRAQIAADCIRCMQQSFLQQEFENHRRLAETYASLNDIRYLEELKICNELRGKITNLYGS